MNRVFLLLGTNLGDGLKNLDAASTLLDREAGQIVRRSSVYRTKAWGKEDQPDFHNQVLELLTRLSPEGLLELILAIEEKMGRSRTVKWGERIIDIDILFFGNLVIESPTLIVPHPQLHLRRFTLQPLAEIAGTLLHPTLNKPITDLLTECPDDLAVEKIVL